MIRAFANGTWFYAEPATRECLGCIFDNERSKVCKQAGDAAVAAGMPDCESIGPGASSYIYRLDLSNGRQMDLLEDMRKQLAGVAG
jgi:hypothetical protein